MSENQRKSFYLPVKQCNFIKELAEINNRPESHFVKIAIDILAEYIGGYGDEADD